MYRTSKRAEYQCKTGVAESILMSRASYQNSIKNKPTASTNDRIYSENQPRGRERKGGLFFDSYSKQDASSPLRERSTGEENSNIFSPNSHTPQNSPGEEQNFNSSILKSSSKYNKQNHSSQHRNRSPKKVSYSPDLNILKFNQRSPVSRRIPEKRDQSNQHDDKFKEKSLEFTKSAKNLLGIFDEYSPEQPDAHQSREKNIQNDEIITGLKNVIGRRRELEDKIREFEKKILME